MGTGLAWYDLGIYWGQIYGDVHFKITEAAWSLLARRGMDVDEWISMVNDISADESDENDISAGESDEFEVEPLGHQEDYSIARTRWKGVTLISLFALSFERYDQKMVERLFMTCEEFEPAEIRRVELTREVVNSIGMKLMLIPAGTFQMGTPTQEQAEIREQYFARLRNELGAKYGESVGEWGGSIGDELGAIYRKRVAQETLHEVEITQPFYLAAFQVTQEQYQRIMGNNPSWFCASGGGEDKVRGIDTMRFPVEMVTWEEAVAFCERLSELPEEKKAGRTYRLPTEAEWEYSCRGGATSHTAFHYGNSLSSTQANFDGNEPHGGAPKGPYLERPCPVGCFAANAFGLFDMHGNVWEWCSDRYGSGPYEKNDYYKRSPKRDPQGPEKGEYRVLRGGCYGNGGSDCRSACRFGFDHHGLAFGFRICCLLDF